VNRAALILAGWVFAIAPAGAEWVSAGPIWNNMDAQGKCPRVCAPGVWDGNWNTVVPGRNSVCSCHRRQGWRPPPRRTGPPGCLHRFEHLIDRFFEHGIAIRVEQFEAFRVGPRNPRTDPEQEAPLEHLIDHRDIGRDHGRVAERQVMDAGAQFDALRLPGEPGDEHQRIGHGLGEIEDMLAAIGFAISKLIREHKDVAILVQRLCIIPILRVNGLREKAKFHGSHSPNNS